MPQHSRFACSQFTHPGLSKRPRVPRPSFSVFGKRGRDFPLSRPLRNSPTPFHTVYSLMKTNLSLSPAAQLETECLVAVVLDRAEKDKTEAYVSSADKAVAQA